MRRLNGFSVGVVIRGNISVARGLECSTPIPNSELNLQWPLTHPASEVKPGWEVWNSGAQELLFFTFGDTEKRGSALGDGKEFLNLLLCPRISLLHYTYISLWVTSFDSS